MKLYVSPRAPNPRRVQMFIAEKGIRGIEEVAGIDQHALRMHGCVWGSVWALPVVEDSRRPVTCGPRVADSFRDAAAAVAYDDEVDTSPRSLREELYHARVRELVAQQDDLVFGSGHDFPDDRFRRPRDPRGTQRQSCDQLGVQKVRTKEVVLNPQHLKAEAQDFVGSVWLAWSKALGHLSAVR